MLRLKKSIKKRKNSFKSLNKNKEKKEKNK